MKKVFVLFVLFIMVILTSCTDNIEENLTNESPQTDTLQQTNPGDDGKIKDVDPDDDGEG
ncbi:MULTISPECIES: hypothetical protein [unclassified Tenacibaculum]|uniref:hypothetical protein n=1 Tax=unclassified Tenacibaculum TaxID=2635139 RepID=UPI001F303619|nr:MULTISPECIES: hypothetical protein [unclassified Tenacibaculum]MCF2875401.1 hypothetical protein [Tenacibaculum sp. Cn5-1]MCF2935477.1 hypothetical protein [Tenacibaculum sp. Cn5-34]MCG7512037.1 hypothetical protein [Tenacibaculum sp. Cn5-46]